MNKLSTLGMAPTLIRKNTVLLEAGDADGGVAAVFEGTITNAWADYQSAPNVPFHVEAHTGLIEAVKPIPASSFQGRADVAVILSGLATAMGLAFENSGVSVILSNPYYSGSARAQAIAAAADAGIEISFDVAPLTLAIWPRLGSRNALAPLVSPETGMIGYPAYTSKGIFVRTIFNRAIGFGGRIKVVSSLPQANEEWIVYGLDHDLEAEIPGGAWFSNIQAAPPGFVPVR